MLRPNPGSDGREELDLLKFALDRMEQRGVRYQQLNTHEQSQLHRYADAVVQQSVGSGAGPNGSVLNEATAALALAGRWRLVLAPQEWSWLLWLGPSADVLVDIDTGEETINYAIHFPNRWQLLQRLQWHARFSLVAGRGGSVQGMTYQIFSLLAVVAGLMLPLAVPRRASTTGMISTTYFDGDLLMDRSKEGLSVYRYTGPVPSSEADDSAIFAEMQAQGCSWGSAGALVLSVLAITVMVAVSIVFMVPLLALTVLVAVSASVVQGLRGLTRSRRSGGDDRDSSSPVRPSYL